LNDQRLEGKRQDPFQGKPATHSHGSGKLINLMGIRQVTRAGPIGEGLL
jgi:hypothetical protein